MALVRTRIMRFDALCTVELTHDDVSPFTMDSVRVVNNGRAACNVEMRDATRTRSLRSTNDGVARTVAFPSGVTIPDVADDREVALHLASAVRRGQTAVSQIGTWTITATYLPG